MARPPHIDSSTQISDEFTELYCSCNNPEHGHTFVMEVTFSHTLSPSAMEFPREALEQIRHTTRMEQQELFKGLVPPMLEAG